ncbi:MAG: hypothetical protein LUQ65_09640 [Candidatus Helarchaeota archaeon]|nr:hypothetical protein [Candidatus Helarchaeota archaeon]
MDERKNLTYIEILLQKIKRKILQGETGEIIYDLNYLISELRLQQQNENADLLELSLNRFIFGQLTDTELNALIDANLHPVPLPDTNYEVIQIPEETA